MIIKNKNADVYYSKKLFAFYALNIQYRSWRKRNISVELETFCVDEERAKNDKREKEKANQKKKKRKNVGFHIIFESLSIN